MQADTFLLILIIIRDFTMISEYLLYEICIILGKVALIFWSTEKFKSFDLF